MRLRQNKSFIHIISIRFGEVSLWKLTVAFLLLKKL